MLIILYRNIITMLTLLFTCVLVTSCLRQRYHSHLRACVEVDACQWCLAYCVDHREDGRANLHYQEWSQVNCSKMMTNVEVLGGHSSQSARCDGGGVGIGRVGSCDGHGGGRLVAPCFLSCSEIRW